MESPDRLVCGEIVAHLDVSKEAISTLRRFAIHPDSVNGTIRFKQ